MKEFWLELDKALSQETIRKIVDESKPHTVLLQDPISLPSTKIASRTQGADILVTQSLDDAAEAKRNRIPVAIEVTIQDKEDYEIVSKALDLGPDYLLVKCQDWKVIPLENLVAQAKGKVLLIARTCTFEESRIALEVLELGADGIALSSKDNDEISKTRDLVANESTDLTLTTARVAAVKPIGSGARVCVDTCDILQPGEGLLTGSSSQGLFLVEAEVHSNPHVSTRPFRVNAGPLSLYVLAPDGKTRYLSELTAGEIVLAVDRNGRTRKVDLARVKIERRPMVLVEAVVGSLRLKTILQNAETVRLVTRDGSKPVSEIRPGDEVLVRMEQGGRHFGTMVKDEMVIEK